MTPEAAPARRPPAPEPIHLRRATPDDIDRIISWELAPPAVDYVNSWPPDRHRAAQADPAQAELVVEAGGRPVGFAILAGLGSETVELVRFAIGEPGRGYGRAALAALVGTVFADPGVRRLWLDVVPTNDRARRVYEAAGFVLDEIRRDATTDRDGRPAPLAFYSLRREPDARSSLRAPGGPTGAA